jgi:2',3'-cyclic-nucleotide 2'-phosphodiesterase
VPAYFDVATGDPRLNGAVVNIDPETGRALSISRVSINQDQARDILTDSPEQMRP